MKLFEIFLLEDRIEYLKNKYVVDGKLTTEQFNNIVQSDPTKNKIYVQWLLNKLNKENPPRFFEDLYKIKEYLDIFDRLKNKFKEKDINEYSFEEFKNDAIRIKNESGDLEFKDDGGSKDPNQLSLFEILKKLS